MEESNWNAYLTKELHPEYIKNIYNSITNQTNDPINKLAKGKK